jgi:hypothetical protein
MFTDIHREKFAMTVFDGVKQWLTRRVPATEPPTAVLPEGCKLTVHGSDVPLPAVRRVTGGAILVFQGLSSDDTVSEFEQLEKDLDLEMRAPHSEVLTVDRPVRISGLFSHETTLTRVPAFLVWVLNPRAMLGCRAAPRLLQTVLYKLFVLATRSPCRQHVVLSELQSPAALFLARLIGEVGIRVGQPAADRSVLVTAERPDGSVVTGLPWQLLQERIDPDPWHVSLQQRKYLAQLANDKELIGSLMSEEHDALSARIEKVPGRTLAVERAARLHPLIRSALASEPDAMKRLLLELIDWEHHLLFFVNNEANPQVVFESHSGAKALAVFPDEFSIKRLHRLRIGRVAPFAMGGSSSRDLFAWMAKEGSGLTLDAVIDEQSIRFVFLPHEFMPSLSEGMLPTSMH